jgi:hypothetical protein
MQSRGLDRTTAVRVVEGEDQGKTLPLTDSARAYVVGRGPDCEMPLADPDASREHLRIVRTDVAVLVEDLGAKNGSWLGGERLPSDQPVPWRPAQMLKVGRTVLALVEPVADVLAEIEGAEDEPLEPEEVSAAPTHPHPASGVAAGAGNAEAPLVPSVAEPDAKKVAPPRRGTWSWLDLLVMGAALTVLALSLVGLFWLLRGASVVSGR